MSHLQWKVRAHHVFILVGRVLFVPIQSMYNVIGLNRSECEGAT